MYHQAAAVKRRYQNLTVQDPDLTNLANNQLVVLRDVVGKRLQSVHQYMIVKAESEEELDATKRILQMELNQSQMFIRKCVLLGPADVAEQLSVLYASPKTDDEIELI